MLTRFALLAVAILALAWLGVLWRDHRIVDGESPALLGDARLTAAEFERGEERLRDAALLNPDPTWRLNLGLALIGRDQRRAVAELRPVVEAEPENVTAWKLLFVAARGADERLAERARERIERLDPLTEL